MLLCCLHAQEPRQLGFGAWSGLQAAGERVTRDQAIRFVRRRGVVLESARGEGSSLAEHIAGGPISGGWWSHAKGPEIFKVTRMLRSSRAVLICGLAGARITYIHRRLWPHFVRAAHRFRPNALDRIVEVHTPSGRHQRTDVPFPDWVPESVLHAAQAVSEPQALREIDRWIIRYGRRTKETLHK